MSSALTGALVLVSADLTARTLLPPLEIPVGALTSLVGGPYLLWLLGRRTAVRRRAGVGRARRPALTEDRTLTGCGGNRTPIRPGGRPGRALIRPGRRPQHEGPGGCPCADRSRRRVAPCPAHARRTTARRRTRADVRTLMVPAESRTLKAPSGGPHADGSQQSAAC
ncbi:iron chelate uptake ABC transporter family permease subunit [Streptomyces sp. NPDC003015]